MPANDKEIKKLIREYLYTLKNTYNTGDYTEFTLRTALQKLIEQIDTERRLIQEPRRTKKLGAPDFKAFLKGRKIGYIETKPIMAPLHNILETEQIKRYIESIDNLILTDYTRFMLIRNGKVFYIAELITKEELQTGKTKIYADRVDKFKELLNNFFQYKLPGISTAEELAMELSRKAKLLKELSLQQLKHDIEATKAGGSPSSIYEFYQGMKGLISDISVEDCADAYAQTVTYGLFLAKRSHGNELKKGIASGYIPQNVGIIRRIFINISGEEFPTNIAWVVDDIIDILNASELSRILLKIDERGKKDKDPIIYFYEDFLNYYEPDKKKHLGVYYTPRPVVNYIATSLHLILKNYFNKPLGFAENEVNALDPAVGTGTFFWITFLVILNELKQKGLKGLMQEKIHKHILKDFYGFELLITPYVISHLKLSDLLQRWHYRFQKEDRLQIYLTNTLKPQHELHEIPFMRELTQENRMANEIKTLKKILVIMGNPPYSGESANKGKWINKLLKEVYKREDGSFDDGYYNVSGKPLGEKNSKWLQDDYVKFIRFSQWKIDQNGEGIIGFITNHSYLDNPTFRGMRESLLQSFDRIFILNLHGNSLKKETKPDGGKDENVFNIKQGVAIGIFIKSKKLKDIREKSVYYADIWGTKAEKYEWLDKHTYQNTPWVKINPISPFYFFVPRNTSLEGKYNNYYKVTEIFKVYQTGIIAGRDKIAMHFTKQELWDTIVKFSHMPAETARNIFKLGKDARDWKVRWAQEDILHTGPHSKYIVPILYRPFDIRYTYYTGKNKGFIRWAYHNFMRHMLKDNLGLITRRQMLKQMPTYVFVTEHIISDGVIRSDNKGTESLFPLYTYTDHARALNFTKEFTEFIKNTYNRAIEPKDILYYIYAVLYSPIYREKYREFLQYDFPRIPFVEDPGDFKQLSLLGKELIELHLMKKRLPIKVKFDVTGSNAVERVRYEKERAWINKKQYFEGIPKHIWNFYIGGYKVIEKWLKSRKGRSLSGEEIETFLQIVEILRATLSIMDRIKGYSHGI